jgi:hypothetical protein
VAASALINNSDARIDLKSLFTYAPSSLCDGGAELTENDGDVPEDLEYDGPDKTLAGVGPEGAISPGALLMFFPVTPETECAVCESSYLAGSSRWR